MTWNQIGIVLLAVRFWVGLWCSFYEKILLGKLNS